MCVVGDEVQEQHGLRGAGESSGSKERQHSERPSDPIDDVSVSGSLPERTATGCGVGRRAETGVGVPDQQHEVCRLDCGGHLQGTLADRVVFQSPETESSGENLCGDERERRSNADLDSIDRYADVEVPATEEPDRLEPISFGRHVTDEPVDLPRFVGLA